MPNAQDAFWFKSQFQPQIEAAIAGTPFSVDMITAVACQETGGIWPRLRRQGLPTARILELCVGDTIDASPTGGGRRAFPQNKAELLKAPQGDRMFAIARQGLVDMAAYIPDYRGAAARPDKFCHGFGIFQLDLQFFKTDPDYFLSRRYADFDAYGYTVTVDDPIWATQLRYLEPAIVTRATALLGPGVVARIKVRVGRP